MTLARYILDTALRWRTEGRPVVVATIVRVFGSSSQPLASRMIVTTGGDFVGFVSGGCVETDVAHTAHTVLQDGRPRLVTYRKVKDSVFEIGLNCEGQIEVLAEPLSDEFLENLRSTEPGAVVTSWRDTGDQTVEVRHACHGGESDAYPGELSETIPDVVAGGRPEFRSGADGWNHMVEPVGTRLTLLIVSANSIAYPLARMGRSLGYRIVISDPRADYLSPERFPDAELLLNVWPRDIPGHVEIGPRVMVVSLNHEPRFEDDLFRMLQSQPPVGYLGALGKRQRHEERIARQEESGVDLSALPPIHTPIGLDIGGKNPEETALSILAEIQAVGHGKSGGPLTPLRD